MIRRTASMAIVAGLVSAGPALAQESPGAPAQPALSEAPSAASPDGSAATTMEDLRLRLRAAESASMGLGARLSKSEAQATADRDSLVDLKRHLEMQQDRIDRLQQDLETYQRAMNEHLKALEDRMATLENDIGRTSPPAPPPDMSQNNGPDAVTPDRGADDFPSDQELDRFFDFAHKAFRRFFGLVDDLKRDFNEERI